MSKRRLGKVKHWNTLKGFGFIRDLDTRKDYFFNRQGMPTPFDTPEMHQRASFVVERKIVGDRATGIEWIKE